MDPMFASTREFSHLGDGFLDSFIRFWLPFVILLVGVALLVWLFNRSSRVTVTDPMRRVAERYAAGDIERTEFERIRRDLMTGEASALPEPATGDPPLIG